MKVGKHRKWMIGLIGVIVLIGVVTFGILQLEKRQSLKGQSEVQGVQKVPDTFLAESERKPRGSVTLYGEEYDYYHEYETYLLIGTDATGKSNTGEAYRGSMADFFILIIMDRTEHSYAVLQLNRDTMTKVTLMQKDGTGYASARLQLCTAHWYGGSRKQSCENTVEAVSNFLGGIPITGYYELNMDKIPLLNHAVGGVEVTIENDFSMVDATMKMGETMTLSDEQAYTFVQKRYNVGDEKNTSRMERQKQYLLAFFQKAKQKSGENSRFTTDLYRELKNDAVTDMTGKTVSRLTKEVTKGSDMGFYTIDGETRLGKALNDGIEHVEFYPHQDSVVQVMTELYGLK